MSEIENNSICHSDCQTSNMIDLFLQIKKIKEEEKNKFPFFVNVIKSALCGSNLKETAHSLILSDLLQNMAIRNSFVRTFTNITSNDSYNVIPEKEHIDVSLRGDKKFIIIENKVNSADEQESQLFRYVQTAQKHGYNPDDIHIVYLNPINRDVPSDFSTTDKDTKESIWNILPEDNIRVFSYKVDIIKWLKEIMSVTNEKEQYLKSALLQYIDYLEEKFECSTKYENMNSRIEEAIIKAIDVQMCEADEKIIRCDNAIKEIDELSTKLKEIRCLFVVEQWKEEILKIYKDKFKIDVHDEHNGYVELRIMQNNLHIITLGIEDGKLWIGIAKGIKNENSYKDYLSQYSSNNLNENNDLYWIWINDGDIINVFRELIDNTIA